MSTNVIINTFKDSSVLDACVYNATRELLIILFKSGSIWGYEKVTQEEFRNLLKAKSSGQYFNKSIRNNHPSSAIFKPGQTSGQTEQKEEETTATT